MLVNSPDIALLIFDLWSLVWTRQKKGWESCRPQSLMDQIFYQVVWYFMKLFEVAVVLSHRWNKYYVIDSTQSYHRFGSNACFRCT